MRWIVCICLVYSCWAIPGHSNQPVLAHETPTELELSSDNTAQVGICAGLCQNVNSVPCPGGYLTGLCPGGTNIKCCQMNTPNCIGQCQDTSVPCATGYLTGQCPGAKNIKCCPSSAPNPNPNPNPNPTPVNSVCSAECRLGAGGRDLSATSGDSVLSTGESLAQGEFLSAVDQSGCEIHAGINSLGKFVISTVSGIELWTFATDRIASSIQLTTDRRLILLEVVSGAEIPIAEGGDSLELDSTRNLVLYMNDRSVSWSRDNVPFGSICCPPGYVYQTAEVTGTRTAYYPAAKKGTCRTAWAIRFPTDSVHSLRDRFCPGETAFALNIINRVQAGVMSDGCSSGAGQLIEDRYPNIGRTACAAHDVYNRCNNAIGTYDCRAGLDCLQRTGELQCAIDHEAICPAGTMATGLIAWCEGVSDGPDHDVDVTGCMACPEYLRAFAGAQDCTTAGGTQICTQTCSYTRNGRTNRWKQPAGTACSGPTCRADGETCIPTTTCNLCCNPSEFWYSKNSPACGVEPCFPDGRVCVPGTSCNTCCNPSTYWWGSSFTACGTEPCWPNGQRCVPLLTCNACCSPSTFWNSKLFTACGTE